VEPAELRWLEPLVERQWEGYEVAFPRYQRRLSAGYASIRSERFHSMLLSHCADDILLGRTAVVVGGDYVRLDDGAELRAKTVIDARGFPDVEPDAVGYQKFVGIDLRLAAPHGLTMPVLMDARCEQRDGFRFFYLLPWSPTEILVEDTRYSDGNGIDVEEYRDEIRHYAERRGWRIVGESREEIGALPIPLTASFLREGTPRDRSRASGVPALGVRAGLFHPTTGYSLPDAVRAASTLSGLSVLDPVAVATALERLAVQAEKRSFYRFLNRMLLLAAAPELRYRVLEKFYRLPEATIARFYRGESSLRDRIRILTGRPPVPLRAAFHCLGEPPRGEEAALREGLFRVLTLGEVAR
jgi:lycopene beta-cyclase